MYHVQCMLSKNEMYQTSWIPEKFAVPGKWIKLKDGDKWDDGWQVMDCGTRELTKKVKEREHDYKRMKKVTDI